MVVVPSHVRKRRFHAIRDLTALTMGRLEPHVLPCEGYVKGMQHSDPVPRSGHDPLAAVVATRYPAMPMAYVESVSLFVTCSIPALNDLTDGFSSHRSIP